MPGAPTTHAGVRQALAAVLEGHAVTAGTLREAPTVYDQLNRADGVPDGRVHLAFAVGILSTSIPIVQRQTQGRDLLVSSRIGVRVLHRLRRSDEVADLDSALTTEGEVVSRLLSQARGAGVSLAYSGTPRRVRVPDPESVLLELTFDSTYTIATS